MPTSRGLVNALEAGLMQAFTRVFGEALVSLVLYGSYARGDFDKESDVDVLVVLESISDRYALQSMLDRVEEELKPLFKCLNQYGYSPAISPIALSREEARVTRPLYLDIVFDAKVLYDKDGFMASVLEKVRRKLSEYGAERVKIGSKWVTVLKKNYRFGEVIEF